MNGSDRCGCVGLRESLLPRKIAAGQSAEMLARKSALRNLCCWIIVPMAPSSTRILSSAATEGLCAFLSVDLRCHSGGLLFEFGEAPKDGRSHRRDAPVHRVEMKFPDVRDRRDREPVGGTVAATSFSRLRNHCEPFETIGEPLRNTGTGSLREICRLLETLHRHDAWRDRNIESARLHFVEKTQ